MKVTTTSHEITFLFHDLILWINLVLVLIFENIVFVMLISIISPVLVPIYMHETCFNYQKQHRKNIQCTNTFIRVLTDFNKSPILLLPIIHQCLWICEGVRVKLTTIWNAQSLSLSACVIVMYCSRVAPSNGTYCLTTGIIVINHFVIACQLNIYYIIIVSNI